MRAVILDFNRTLYNPETHLLVRRARRVLYTLRHRGYVLYLLSFGGSERLRLIDSLDIRRYFRRVIIVRRKSVRTLQMLVRREKITPTQSFVVGDKVRDEIKIGNRCGFQTIWIKTGRFAAELPLGDIEQPWRRIQQLSDVLGIIPRRWE